MVNHWGTIILAEPLELPDDGRRYIDEETDWDYSPLEGKGTANHKPCTTISDFMTAYVHQSCIKNTVYSVLYYPNMDFSSLIQQDDAQISFQALITP